MEKYIFTCIGTNKIIQDSFGPKVGDILQKQFKDNSNIKIFGTMKKPIHFKNAEKMINELKNYKNYTIVLIDSAYAEKLKIGNTYVSPGGIEIGKAFGKNFYFPADFNIKTIVENKLFNFNSMDKIKDENKIKLINELSVGVADMIIKNIY